MAMLKGEKVLLRALVREDLDRLVLFNNDIAVEVAGGGDPPLPQSLARLQADFDGNIGKGDRDGTSFAIEAGGLFIGQCALFQFDPIARTAELGITIGDHAYWGRGYGREALTLLLGYGFRHHNLHRIWLTVNATNDRAMAAYRTCGFREEGRLREHVWSDGKYIDFVYMGLLRREWGRSAA